MGVKGSGTIRNDAATHKDGRVNRIFPLTRSYRERRGSLFILVRTFPFRVAIHSTSYGFVPRPVCCAVRADKRRGYDVRVGRPVRETRSVTRAVVPSRIGVSSATCENVSFFRHSPRASGG